MQRSKRLSAPLVVMSGMLMAVAFAAPANASEGVYPPPQGTTVLGSTATAPQAEVAEVEVAGASAGNLAFTGSNAVGIGAFGGLLLAGGGAMVIAGRRRKASA